MNVSNKSQHRTMCFPLYLTMGGNLILLYIFLKGIISPMEKSPTETIKFEDNIKY